MTNWLFVAILAYLLLAIVNLLDKFLVDNVIKNSRAYAFVACVLGLAVMVLAPWFLSWPGWLLLAHNLFNGFIFALALWFLYEALRRGEAARILVLVGGLTPVFSLAFSLIFLGERFSLSEWQGIAFILLGIFLLVFLPAHHSYLSRIWNYLRFKQVDGDRGVVVAFLSALAYSIYFLSTKQAYFDQPFMSAFIWTRLGAAIFVLFFLFKRIDREAIRLLWKGSRSGASKWLVIFNQTLGASGFILQNYAIFLGSVVLVNALQGVQYALLLLISTVLAIWAPHFLKEDFSWRRTLHKAVAVIAIFIGLYFIAL